MTGSDLPRLKDLQAENAVLKRLFADAMLNNAGLKGLLAKSSRRLNIMVANLPRSDGSGRRAVIDASQ